MPINTETLNRRLYKVLSKYKPKPLDSSGEVTPIEDEADIFKFTFTKNGEQYGEVYATIDDSRTLKIYYGDDVIDSPEAPTPGVDYDDTWFGFLRFLKSWAHQNQLGWDLENKDHLAGDMARREHVKKTERISEGYYPMGKKASYSDAIPTVKMVIQHSREIQEGEQRYRNVARIFLENQLGERILAPTTKPGIAQIYARHIAEGGLPHDERWNHIGSLCEEYNKMAGFVRATRGGQFNESAQQLVESGIQHYNKLRESLSKMRGHRGYNMYFESWTPPLMEDETDTSSINELFVQETMDPRIESVMPILSKLHKTVAEMREVDELAEWADNLLEGGDGPEASEETDGDTPGDAGEGGAEDAPMDNLSEAPGAETLAHNQATEKSRLDAFDLDESDEMLSPDTYELIDEYIAKIEPDADREEIAQSIIDGTIHTSELEYALQPDLDEGILDTVKKVGGKVLDKLGHGSDEDLLKDLKKRAGVRNPENGKPSMAQSDVEKVDEVDMGQYDAVKSSLKGKDTSDWDKNFREKLKQYAKELEQRQKDDSEKVEEGEFAGDYATGEAGQWRNKGPKAHKPATIGDLVGENFINTDAQAVVTEQGNFSKAIENLHGWYQGDSTDPEVEVFYFDDREGGYYADGIIEHNLATGEITVDFADKTGGEYGGDTKGTFNSIGDAMNALRGITTQIRYNSGKTQNHDSLANKTLAGPDDLYKTDRAGKKGTLTKARMDGMKASSPYTMRGGPKGVLPEGQEDLDAIKRLLGK